MRKTILGSIRGLKLEMNLAIRRSNLIRVVVLKVVRLLLLLVGTSTAGNVYLVPRIALVVVKMDIR